MNSDYFLMYRENNESYPLLEGDSSCPYYEYEEDYIENPVEMEFRLGRPVPRKPRIVDYHATPYSVVSRKIYDVLEPLKIQGLQLIPATITGKNNELYEDYWFLHIYNYYSVLDKTKSVFTWNSSLKLANPIRKIALNEKKLQELPLEQRLMFRLRENETKQFYHKSIVDAILAVTPEGVKFSSVENWNVGTLFDK